MLHITKILLNTEERARKFFERLPFIQAFIAGAGAIIFWRGIWELLDKAKISPEVSVILGTLLLGGVGVFIQTFLGNTIIIKNVKQEEKLEKKALARFEGEVVSEEITIKQLADKIDALQRKIEEKQN